MSNTVIQVDTLWKEYRLGVISHHTLAKDLQSRWARMRGKEDPNLPLTVNSGSNEAHGDERFWALQDVSFEVKQGEILGIIGRNGAGKSTLLKILSQVTTPTKGEVRYKGRIASLLEVGTGFHPELTGRENIFLNGAILGMNKAEIKRKLDEIIAFAEVERFIDTPVKRYSSGMYVRLAFAVAAHLEPEILIVDEVLAVGDAQFQKKCLGKMEDVSVREGRTVLFVSHNFNMINLICNNAILLEEGKICSIGPPSNIISAYYNNSSPQNNYIDLKDRIDRTGSGRAIFTDIKILNKTKEIVNILNAGEDYFIQIGYDLIDVEPIINAFISIDIFDEKNNRILLFRNNFYNFRINITSNGNTLQCHIPNIGLATGKYTISLYMSYADTERLDYIDNASSFEIQGGDFFGTGSGGLPSHCKILSKAHWSLLS